MSPTGMANALPSLTTAASLRSTLSKTTNPLVAMSTHSPLSALLALQSGFRALWLSGFELSALHAVPDAQILPYSTHLDLCRSVSQTVLRWQYQHNNAVPGQATKGHAEEARQKDEVFLIADIDTGFGNAVNVAYTIPQYVNAGVTAVVMEDKVFPKISSLRSSTATSDDQPSRSHGLVTIAEFQGKLRAAKAAAGGDMLVIARTEALIAGLGLNEALARGKAYVEAGADALLVHSKQKTPDEVLEFCRCWDASVAPLVLVPTAYPQLTFKELGKADKVGMVICGNHAMRSAVQGMRRCFEGIQKDGGLGGVEGEIAGVGEVFDLMGDGVMREIEREFVR